MNNSFANPFHINKINKLWFYSQSVKSKFQSSQPNVMPPANGSTAQTSPTLSAITVSEGFLYWCIALWYMKHIAGL